MKQIGYRGKELFVEDVPIIRIARNQRTPFFVYSKQEAQTNFTTWQRELKGINAVVCYALKANENLELIRLFQAAGSGADVVSAGELYLARTAGVPPGKIVFAGVGKQDFEIEYGLREGIRAFNVESAQELKVIQEIAQRMDKVAPVQIRVNPDIDAQSHPYITTGMASNKFGIETSTAIELCKFARNLSNIFLRGLHVHIGSQLLDLSPFEDCSRALRNLFFILKELDILIETIDLGGGLGVDYHQVIDWPPAEDQEADSVPTVRQYLDAVLRHLRGLPLNFIFEPGRSMIANTAVLVTRVVYTKSTSTKKFVIVDAGMNDLIRPSLYQAYHRILPVCNPMRETCEQVDVVGPICETADFLAKARNLPPVSPDELLAVFSAGAYGYSLSSNYNGRLRPAEILVDGGEFRTIRRSETYEDLLKLYEIDSQ